MYHYLTQLRHALSVLPELLSKVDRLQLAAGRIEAQLSSRIGSNDIQDHEFRVYSQWGEDGIIEYLVSHLDITNKTFVEFGVENYRESNTRFLLMNRNWSGLVIDGSKQNIRAIKNDDIYWRYNLKAEHAFITRENIDKLIHSNGIQGEIGLLSVDLDGNDYWVWDAISVVESSIVIAEYNHRFGKERAVTVPYIRDFVRNTAHHSTVYYGASLKALAVLAQRKGYALVGCNSAGNNAFFVRRELLNAAVTEKSVDDAYVAAQFREARDAHGRLQAGPPSEEVQLINGLPLVEIQ